LELEYALDTRKIYFSDYLYKVVGFLCLVCMLSAAVVECVENTTVWFIAYPFIELSTLPVLVNQLYLLFLVPLVFSDYSRFIYGFF
jgi:hypothetical protein